MKILAIPKSFAHLFPFLLLDGRWQLCFWSVLYLWLAAGIFPFINRFTPLRWQNSIENSIILIHKWYVMQNTKYCAFCVYRMCLDLYTFEKKYSQFCRPRFFLCLRQFCIIFFRFSSHLLPKVEKEKTRQRPINETLFVAFCPRSFIRFRLQCYHSVFFVWPGYGKKSAPFCRMDMKTCSSVSLSTF